MVALVASLSRRVWSLKSLTLKSVQVFHPKVCLQSSPIDTMLTKGSHEQENTYRPRWSTRSAILREGRPTRRKKRSSVRRRSKRRPTGFELWQPEHDTLPYGFSNDAKWDAHDAAWLSISLPSAEAGRRQGRPMIESEWCFWSATIKGK